MRILRTWLPIGVAALGLAACGGGDSGGTGGDGGKGGDGFKQKPVNVIDLVVDANRDGRIDPADAADQDREEEWNAEVGASFLANLDDDDGDGKRDCEDEIVNTDADLWDLATFLVNAWPEAPDEVTGHVFVDQEAAESVRIFKKGLDGNWVLAMGSMGPCTNPGDCTYAIDHKLTAEEVRAGVTFAIEARRFKGMALPTFALVNNKTDDAKKFLWDGTVNLHLQIEKGDGSLVTSDKNPDGIDRVKMRVAPWLLLGSLGDHDTMYSSKASAKFVAGNTIAAQAAEVAYGPYVSSPSQPGGWPDIWTEDFFQTGWTGFPGEGGAVRGMRIANARPWGRDYPGDTAKDVAPIRWILGNPAKGRTPGFLGADRGGAAFYNPEQENTGHTQDSHGNHDLIPPHQGFPLGRIITGTKSMANTVKFYDAQGVQGPTLLLDTTWLAVEHVDEFFHWVPAKTPRGWKMLYASPAMMLKMLQDFAAAGQGSAVIHAGKGGFFEMTVAQALANPDLNEWSQIAEVKVKGHIDTLKAETGLTDEEIIGIPTWFEDLGGNVELVAWNPGMVNMRMLGNVADIAKPFGPIIKNKDPFEEDLILRLGSPMHALGTDGQGLKIFFTDDWYYHSALGEVHCGTNESAPVTLNEGAWWESGK